MDTTPMQTQQVAEKLAAHNRKKISEDPIAQWERMAAQTISLVGEEGFDSLYTRSVFLTQPDFPWLGAIQRTSRLSPRFTELKRVLAKQPPKTASKANELLLQRFTSILVSLIGDELITVAVNTSALEFRAKDFVKNVHATLPETGLEPCYLELELTESVLMRNAESTGTVLRELADMGIKLAVDDFGTGYSSLSYLRKFPIDTLKIDQSFVKHMTRDPDDATIVRAVISMGKSLKQRVIAEGVETPEQYSALLAHDCQEGQGYYFSRPLPADAFAGLLGNGISETVLNTVQPFLGAR